MKVCKNCGGEEGLHEYETLRCPRNGQECMPNRVQLWQNTFWNDGKTEDEIELLNMKVALLLTSVENLIARIENIEKALEYKDE